jgi:hypothetical protein
MKKPLLLLALLLTIGANAFAQCGDVKEKKDPFSNKTTKHALVKLGNLSIKWAVEVDEVDGNVGMKWSIAMQGEFNQRINEGTDLLLKLADGTVIKLPTTEPSNPVTQALNGGAGTINVFTTYVLKYNVPKETVAQLAKSPITDFKIDVSDQRIKNPKVKDNQMEKIQDVFKCLNK